MGLFAAKPEPVPEELHESQSLVLHGPNEEEETMAMNERNKRRHFDFKEGRDGMFRHKR